jgi:proline racemase
MSPLVVDAIEVHAEGEPGRVLPGVHPMIHGDTMSERLRYCRDNLQWLRHLMLHEPRGYPGLCAVMIVPATGPDADFGIIVMEQGGFTAMSGSNTMCAVTAVLESGAVAVTEPVTSVVIDTAVGTVRAEARVSDGRVEDVTVANVPAYVAALDQKLDVSELGAISVDVVFGGQFFVQTKASDVGLELDPRNGSSLARAGALIKMAADDQIEVQHPDNPDINGVALVMLHDDPITPGTHGRNTVVLTNGHLNPSDERTWTGVLDRSPCGTGTSARMAAKYARGELAIGQDFIHESIIGTRFVGRLTAETSVAGRPAVLPTITGRTWVTGRSSWTLHETDPFPEGYTLGDIWAP